MNTNVIKNAETAKRWFEEHGMPDVPERTMLAYVLAALYENLVGKNMKFEDIFVQRGPLLGRDQDGRLVHK